MQAFWALLQLPLHTVYIAHISKHGGDDDGGGDDGGGDGDDGDSIRERKGASDPEPVVGSLFPPQPSVTALSLSPSSIQTALCIGGCLESRRYHHHHSLSTLSLSSSDT